MRCQPSGGHGKLASLVPLASRLQNTQRRNANPRAPGVETDGAQAGYGSLAPAQTTGGLQKQVAKADGAGVDPTLSALCFLRTRMA